jgi:hypothetical protein
MVVSWVCIYLEGHTSQNVMLQISYRKCAYYEGVVKKTEKKKEELKLCTAE